MDRAENEVRLSNEQLSELWRQAVHNKAFQLGHDCQDLRAALEILAPPEMTVYDKFNVFERQLRVVESELRRLREYVAKLTMPWDRRVPCSQHTKVLDTTHDSKTWGNE